MGKRSLETDFWQLYQIHKFEQSTIFETCFCSFSCDLFLKPQWNNETITILSLQIYVPASTCIAGENAAFVRVSRHFALELSASLQAILEKKQAPQGDSLLDHDIWGHT